METFKVLLNYGVNLNKWKKKENEGKENGK